MTVQASPMVVQYNTDMVPADRVPSTWKEVANPKWKGKFGCGALKNPQHVDFNVSDERKNAPLDLLGRAIQ